MWHGMGGGRASREGPAAHDASADPELNLDIAVSHTCDMYAGAMGCGVDMMS